MPTFQFLQREPCQQSKLNHDHHNHQNRNHNKIYNNIKLGLFGTLTTILLTGCQPDPDLSKVATEVKATEVDALGFTPASSHTASANQAVLSELPFDDVQDFEDAKRGFIDRKSVV